MKSVKERVIAQVRAEWHDCSQEKAEQVISSMTQWELLEYISAATDEMFKEFDDAVSLHIRRLSNRNGG